MLDSPFDSTWMRWLDRQLPADHRVWSLAAVAAVAAGLVCAAVALVLSVTLGWAPAPLIAASAGAGGAAAGGALGSLVEAQMQSLRARGPRV